MINIIVSIKKFYQLYWVWRMFYLSDRFINHNAALQIQCLALAYIFQYRLCSIYKNIFNTIKNVKLNLMLYWKQSIFCIIKRIISIQKYEIVKFFKLDAYTYLEVNVSLIICDVNCVTSYSCFMYPSFIITHNCFC